MKIEINPRLLQALQGDVDARQLMSEAKFFESYSRWDDNLGRYETWDEAVHRVMEMHRTFYKDKMTDELSGLMDEVEQAYKDKLFLGSQRALQFGGEQLLKNHSKNFNCTATYIDRVEVFAEIFHLMLSGCGVGFSVQYRHIEKMPKIKSRGDEVVTFVIPDSIEGWAESCDALVSSYFVSGGRNPEYRGKKIKFDYSLVRPKGALVSGGFKAPGPDGLRIALENIQALINKALEEGRDTLTSIELYDIIMFISDAVISGGVRRSATICMFTHTDELMLNAKTGDWWNTNKQRSRSNNSAMLLRGSVTKEEFEHMMESVKDYGEPGFIWVDDLDALFNPCCVTGDTLVMTNEGPKLVTDLLGKQFTAIVNGKEYLSTEDGFWKTGTKQTYTMTLKNGIILHLTNDHRVLTLNRSWVELKDLTINDEIIIHNHNEYEWSNIEAKKYYENKMELLLETKETVLSNDKYYSKIEAVELSSMEDVYDVTIPGPNAFDANGIYVHNCEIGLYGYTRDGESGISVCNLAEVNGMLSTSKEIFLKQCKYASIICTLQAGYTDFKFQSEATRKIIEDEALIGVSITGWMNNPETLFDIDILDAGVNEVAKWNEITASLIDINIAARMTTVKPAGNTSTLLGSSSGIHGEHSKYYLRHVQFNKETEIAKLFMEHYPKMVEPSVYSTNDIVVAFPVMPKEGSIFKKDLLGVKQLDYVVKAQKYWVAKGTRKDRGIKPWLVHNVSNTITVDDWDVVTDYIYDNRNDLGGVSLLAATGDKAYTQAPFTEVIMLEDIVAKYGDSALFASGLIEAGLTAFNGDLWNAINTACGFGEKLTDSAVDLLKRDFVRRFNKFSHRFMPNHIEEVKDYIIHYDKYEYIENKMSGIKEELNETMNDLLGNSSRYERLAGDMIRYVRELEDIRPYLNSTKINEHKQESVQLCSECLKDVYNLHKWINIRNSLKKELKWEELLTEKKYTDVDTIAAQACSGGACEIGQ